MNKKSSAPIKAGWICLFITWVLFLIPLPGTGLIGWPLNFAAFVVSIVIISKGATKEGVTQMLCSIIVSPVVYFIGIALTLVFIRQFGQPITKIDKIEIHNEAAVVEPMGSN